MNFRLSTWAGTLEATTTEVCCTWKRRNPLSYFASQVNLNFISSDYVFLNFFFFFFFFFFWFFFCVQSCLQAKAAPATWSKLDYLSLSANELDSLDPSFALLGHVAQVAVDLRMFCLN